MLIDTSESSLPLKIATDINMTGRQNANVGRIQNLLIIAKQHFSVAFFFGSVLRQRVITKYGKKNYHWHWSNEAENFQLVAAVRCKVFNGDNIWPPIVLTLTRWKVRIKWCNFSLWYCTVWAGTALTFIWSTAIDNWNVRLVINNIENAAQHINNSKSQIWKIK